MDPFEINVFEEHMAMEDVPHQVIDDTMSLTLKLADIQIKLSL